MNNPTEKKSLKPLFIAFVVLAAAFLVIFFLPKSTTPEEVTPEPKDEPVVEATYVNAYFANSGLDPEITCTKVFPVSRQLPKGENDKEFAIRQLLAGPRPEERSDLYETAINANTKLLSLRVADGVAYADFDKQLNFEVGGSCRVGFIRTQIEQTLKQFSDVREVVISVEGQVNEILEP